MAKGREEIIVPWPSENVGRCTHVRSTLLSSSLQTLKKRGHYDRYVELLPAEHHEAVLLTLAATWLPIADGVAHYRACDALGLSDQEQIAIGNSVGDRIQGTFIGQLGKRARGIGANPWIPLAQFMRLWGRLLQGGGVQVVKLGPKDARIDVQGSQLHEIKYFRVAFQGVVGAATDVFAKKSFAKELPGSHRGTSISYSLSWV